MLKSLNRCAILNKGDNGIIVSLRQFYRKMQDQGKYEQNSFDQKFFNDSRSNINEFRKWITVTPEPKKPGFAFSVLNYNILSQQLLEMHNYLYQDHANHALRWNQRFCNLVGEIMHNNPDILCCQVSALWINNLSMSFTDFFCVLQIFRKCKSLIWWTFRPNWTR